MKNKNDKEKNKLGKIFKTFSDDSQKKAWLVLGIYFIFFAILIFSIRTNQEKTENVESNISNLPFSISKIKTNNYDFKYIVNFDDNIVTYEGKNYQNNSLFTLNNTDIYYQEGNAYFKKQNESFINSDNPYKFGELRNIDILEKILKQSKLESHTIYEDSTKNYNYQITTDTLEKIINNRNIDTDLVLNNIVVYVDSSNEAYKFVLNFSSYTNYKSYTINKGIIEITYSNFLGNSQIKENVSE